MKTGRFAEDVSAERGRERRRSSVVGTIVLGAVVPPGRGEARESRSGWGRPRGGAHGRPRWPRPATTGSAAAAATTAAAGRAGREGGLVSPSGERGECGPGRGAALEVLEVHDLVLSGGNRTMECLPKTRRAPGRQGLAASREVCACSLPCRAAAILGAAMEMPRTRYARNGSVHIAYQVVGDGPHDLLFITSCGSPPSSTSGPSRTSPRRCGACRRSAGWSSSTGAAAGCRTGLPVRLSWRTSAMGRRPRGPRGGRHARASASWSETEGSATGLPVRGHAPRAGGVARALFAHRRAS